MESESERDLATQNVEARSDEENKSKETNENITNLEAEEGKARQGSGDKKGNLREGRGTEVENKTTEVEGKQQQQHTARKSEHGGADGEEASLSSVRNPKATKGDPEARPRDAGMNGAPQFSDVAKQIMKEVQETRNRRNKCLRDLRSMKPKAARIYIARRYKERAAEKKTPQSASLGISEGQKDEDSLKSLSPIPEATSPSLPQSSPKTKKNSVDSSSPSEAVQDPASFVFSPGDHHEAQPMSKALQGSSVSLRREERGEKNRKSENSSTQENPGEARCSSSSFSSSTTNNENKFQNEQGETFEGVEVAKKELISLKSSPPPLPLPSVDPSMVEGSELRQLDSGDTLTKNSPGTEAEATGGRTQQCLAAAGRVRVCGSAPSSVATAAATTTLQSRSSSSHFHNPDATHGKTIENSVQLTSDAVDNNGNIDAGGAVQGEGLLKVPGKLPPRVVEVKHKTGAGPSLEPPPPCNPPHSAGSEASATNLSSTQDPEQEKQGVKKTHAPKNGRDGRVSGAEQQSLANSSEVFDNADNESKEIGESGSSLKLNDHSQGAKKAEARTSMRQDDGKEAEALEGPWATPQLARVVQELVVSRKFNMSSSQAKKRQQNLTRLDAQQKDRTLIFDSSRLIKAEDKSEVPPEPQNETSKGTQNPSQAQKSGSRSVSRIIGRKNRRGNGNGEHFAHGNPTKKGKQNQPQESKTARLTGEEEGRHKQTKPQIKENSQDKNTKNESVQPEGRDGNAVEVGEILKCEGNKAKLVEHDDSNTLQPPPRIEQLSRSPQHPRPRLRKIVENLTLVHNQASPRSSPQPGSPAFSSSLNSSPRFIENSPRSPSGVSPLPISPRARASKMVALSPRFVEALSPPEVEIVDGKNVTEAMQGGSNLQQHFEARAPSSSAQRDNVQREDNTSMPPTPRKSKEEELLSPLRRTSTRNDAPTELIFNFMKLPEITTDSCSTKSDQKLPGSESSPQAESNAGQARNKERQRGPELQPSEVSKPGAGKLDSDILQFFESRQYKPREIVRNETLITEHFRGTNTKLRTHGDGRNRGAASRNMSKGSSCDIEPGRRDRTFSDPMEKSPRGSRNAGKLRSVKSFDDSSVVRSSASEEETEEENETRNIKKRKEEMTPERSNGKGKASKAHIEVATEVDDASEYNIFITSVNDSNRGKTEATTDTARQQPTPSARDRPPKTEESEEQNNKRKAFAGISGSQNFTGEEGVYSATNFQENPKKIEAVPYNTIKSQNTSENGQRNSDKATDRPSVLSGNSPSPKGVGLDILQAGVTHGAKKQGGESDTVLNATKSVEEISDRKRLTNSNEVIVTSDSTSIPSLQREKGKETTPSVPRVTGVNPFMAVVQELQEKAGRGVGRRKEVECDGGLPLQDDLVGEVANSRSTTSSVHRVTPALPPLPPPPESSSGLASLTGSPGSNPNLDHRLDDRKPNTKDEKHHHDLSEGSRDASSGTELVVKNPEELEGAKKASRDSVIFHLTLVGSGGKREKDAEQITPELSPQSIVIQKKIHATSAVESEKRTFLETCVDDIEPQQQQQQGSPFPSQDAFNKTVAKGVKSSKADHITGEDIEKIYDVINVTETNKTFNPGRGGGGGGGGGNGGTGERAGRGGTAASRRLPKCHRRLTKTISEGSFSLDQQEPDTSDSSNQDPVKLPRPPSLLRSRTESEFSPERLASAAAVECEASSKASTVSEIFARGVYGRLKAKSHSAENIRMSSLSCVEIPFSHEPPALPSAALYPNVFSLSSSSSCRIVGVLKKKHSADDFLDSRKQRMDNQPIRGNGNSHGNPGTGQYPFALESACVKDDQAPQDTAGNDSKLPTAPPPSESTQRDTTVHQQAPEVQEKNISSSSQSGKAGKSSLSSNPSSETPIYQNIPEALLYQKKTEAAMVKNSQQSQMKEEQQKPSTGDQKKPLQKVIHIYENMPIVAGREPQEEGAVLESPKRITQPVPESSISGNDFPESTGSSSLPSTSPISDVFFPSKRATFEKTSLRRKQQPESESRIEKQKSNYMKQRSVRVGILKKQKSDITGVRLQKLQYFDTELPGELRRSYSLSGNGVQNKEPRSPKNGPEDDTGPDIPDTDAKQRGEGKEELSDLERRCHSSISNTSRSSTIDRILQSCAPCISSNTTSSTLDLSSPLPLSQSPQKKNVFYSGGESTGGTAGRLVRRQHPRAKHPYKSSYSSSDVTLLSSGALPEASHGANFGKQPTKAVQENSFKAAYHKGQSAPEQVPRTAEPAESCYINSSQDTGSTSGLASSETSSSLDEAANNSKQNMKDDGFAGCDRDSCTPTPEQSGGPNGDTDFYSELLDTILSVVDAQEQSFSAEVENLCFSEEAENLGASEGAASRLSERRGNQVQDNGDNNKAKNHKKHPTAVTSDSDSTTSVDSELAEVRRRITERFPPAPRADPEASQESVLASPSAVCPMPDCAACRSINFSEPLVFAFDQPITPPVHCEPERASSLPFVDHAIIKTSSDHFIRSTSLPHDPDIYHSTQVMCRHDQDEEEYWSAGEETARGTPQGTPRHHSAFQGHLPQHLKHQPKPVPLRNELSSLEDSMTKASSLQDSSLQDSSPHDSSPLTDSGVEIKDHSELTSNQLVEEVSQLRLENEKLSARNRNLQSEVEELRRVKESRGEDDASLKPKIGEMTVELTHAKEALSALKADRKRLKAEKFDLLNQMKQLYATLEDKEKELRDFIRNYEQRMKDSDESLRHLAAERDETEREKWSILKHARDESERVVKLSTQLSLKEATVKKLQEELDMVRKQLNSVGYYSDAESVRTNGLPTPTASTPTCSPLPVATPTPTPNGRGSSADSGVRLSSDRESTASHDGAPFLLLDRGSVDCDSYRCAAVPQYLYYACGPGTPKESPSLSPLYATPAYCRAGDDQSGRGDRTPTSVQTPAPMSGLANSSANAGGLSRSAEHLCERLSEGGEVSKAQGTSTLMRKNHKSGGTWGSISRVFARQKKRAALDTSIYDGIGSDKRASWSPSSSLCASPLTEESYSEKLRLLEEAQHIPLERWKAPTVLAWLEVTLGMAQYGAMCAENVRSGKVLLELSDSELEAGLGITHPMHRKKLRLAIEELREPRLTRYPRISALGHIWVSSEWLPDLGLPQYSDNFANSLVDGRLLEALTKKELEKHLGVHRKFHQASIIHGVHLLRIVRFDRQVLAERRRQSELVDTDPVVWTNLRWVRWARSIDLAEYAENLKDSGVHGALVVLEPSFTADTMATALGIPQSKNIIRRHLATELEGLVNPARQQLDEQARYAKMERRRQEKLASGGSLGRSFSRSYGTGLEKGDKDKRRSSLRPLQKQAFAFPTLPSKGSLSRALGLRMREETASVGSTNGGGESSSSGGQSPAVTTRAHPRHGPHARPRSSIMPSQAYFHHETHRRVKSIGDIETITVTPV
ncbi:uncharacterized protein LOC127006798 isoform X4 [Eriocheir sinensis]|uniref:uncharacterized protein LOC127006798 isoform X4 n=1 Tax=Eriocheir sinensis TaxID=95602 RepID=UPI0021C992E4|nr:uncharacterized protein LOC127006798 isoform X4 [Eriocheir sinensis]